MNVVVTRQGLFSSIYTYRFPQKGVRTGWAAACRRRRVRRTRPTRRPAPTPARRTAVTAKQVRLHAGGRRRMPFTESNKLADAN